MKSAKPAPAKNRRKAGASTPQPEGLPVRQLKLVGVAALLFGIVTAVLMSWELMFPVPPEQLVEVAWTHQCRCARGWMQALRSDGFVVRDFETDNLVAVHSKWQVPQVAAGCHPARFMGYVLDGHVPAHTLRRLALERPPALALLQARTLDPRDVRFELLEADGTRRAWP